VKYKRNVRTGPQRPVRILWSFGGGFTAIALAAAPAAAQPAQAMAAIQAANGQSVSDFFDARDDRPLWFSQAGRPAAVLLELLASAELDGLSPDRYPLSALEESVRAASSGKKRAVRRADLMLSQAFVAYVRDLRRPADTGTLYVDEELKPVPPSSAAILEAAAKAPSLERYVAEMRWMNPVYAQLRQALTSGTYSPEQRDLIRVNMERVRELPGGKGRYVIVNAAAQRLSMFEDGREVDSMRVVVGKPVYPTPMMAAYIRFANLNPYWYVPADLAAERIAPNVLREGLPYLERQGYEVVSDFVGEPKVFDPATIDWQAVADGRLKVLIRQLPGPRNSMGRIKFMFPNSVGVYLHDNPERQVFEEASRLYSGGCVRLEAAWRLSHWLFGRELSWEGAGTEEKVPLDKPVPVYITYLTTVPDGSAIAFLDDVYGRDKERLAEIRGQRELLAANAPN
jgi:murein L,D-transpeptidase YcbB/YkuD